jgi:GT2 family glycosyltransferase
MSRIAVVILNYNGEKLLRQFLPSVIANSGEAGIYVADNGSSDSSVFILEAEFPSVSRILLKENYGFCGGYNRALKEVDADYFVLLNSDVEVTPGWLEPMSRVMNENPDVGAVQPKILSYTRRSYFEYAGAAGGFIDRFGYPFCRGRLFDHVEEDHHQYDDIRPVFWASGACLMVRSRLFHQFGGFDEDFFAHMEEIDLCWKIQRAGFSVYYCGLSTVYHLGAGTLGYKSPRKAFLNFRNGLVMMVKHYSTAEMLTQVPIRVALDWVAGLMFLFKGKPRVALAVLRAHMAILGNLSGTLRKRRAIQKAYPTYPRHLIFPGLALLHTLGGGRKTLNWPSNPK